MKKVKFVLNAEAQLAVSRISAIPFNAEEICQFKSLADAHENLSRLYFATIGIGDKAVIVKVEVTVFSDLIIELDAYVYGRTAKEQVIVLPALELNTISTNDLLDKDIVTVERDLFISISLPKQLAILGKEALVKLLFPTIEDGIEYPPLRKLI